MTRIQCNVCGKDTTNEGVYIEIKIHKPVGYSSLYDGEEINLDVCAKCQDIFLNAISKVCKIPPVHITKE